MPSSSSEAEEEYSVESILAESWDPKLKCTIYLIKWEGYDLYESSWEPKQSFLRGSKQILRNWTKVKRKRAAGELEDFDLNKFELERIRWLAQRPEDQPNEPETTHPTFSKTKDPENVSEGEAEEANNIERSPRPRPRPVGDQSPKLVQFPNSDQERKRKNQSTNTLASSSATKLQQDAGEQIPSPVKLPSGSDPHGNDASRKRQNIDHATPTLTATILAGLSKPLRVLPNFTKVAQGQKDKYTGAVALAKAADSKALRSALDLPDPVLPNKLSAQRTDRHSLVRNAASGPSLRSRTREKDSPPPKKGLYVQRADPEVVASEEKGHTGSGSGLERRKRPSQLLLVKPVQGRSVPDPYSTQFDGAAYLTDSLATDPNCLFDLIVKLRGKTWKLYMTSSAYETIRKGDPYLAQDYQTLHRKKVFALTEQGPLDMAIQAVSVYPHSSARFVVLKKTGDDIVLLRDLPAGVEIRSFDYFIA